MPTGYTADVQSGKITAFPDFAKQCARAFGALIMCRDDAMDAPFPTKFEPSTYDQDRRLSAIKKVARLNSLTRDQKEGEFDAYRYEEVKRLAQWIAENKEQCARYRSMLALVNAWTPPTSEHEGLKKFMVEQLTSSIDFDDSGKYYRESVARLEAMTCDEWFTAELSSATRAIIEAEESQNREYERTEKRNAWIRDLLASLGEGAQ